MALFRQSKAFQWVWAGGTSQVHLYSISGDTCNITFIIDKGDGCPGTFELPRDSIINMESHRSTGTFKITTNYFGNIDIQARPSHRDAVMLAFENIRRQKFPFNIKMPVRSPDASGDPNSDMAELIADLNSVIGLEGVKKEVVDIVNRIKAANLRSQHGLPNIKHTNHMVFYGNPGTGKTTVARLMAKIFSRLGVLSKGHLVEAERSKLVGGYLGQTAIKTTEVLKSALGGILFIDEAYALSSGDGNDQFGQEAINTLLKFMEDHREDLVVIVAGYKQLMRKFLESNPGMKSRFNKYFYFHDYTEDELYRIYLLNTEAGNYILDVDAKEYLRLLIRELVERKKEYFGNGRAIRNLFEKSVQNQANRIIGQNSLSKDELMRITKEDIDGDDMLDISD